MVRSALVPVPVPYRTVPYCVFDKKKYSVVWITLKYVSDTFVRMYSKLQIGTSVFGRLRNVG